MHHYSDKIVAMVCHDTLTGMGRAHDLMRLEGTDAIPAGPFMYLHPDLLAAAVNGVREARNGEAPSPREHHQRWKAFLESRGWRRGPRNPGEKTHPNLVDWGELAPEQRDKCRVFLGIVVNMTVDVGAA
jgi:hypothetical protein